VATLVGAGVTLHECLKAAEELAHEGVPVRVLDLYSIKPIDRQALIESLTVTRGKLVTVEDHWPEGGLGDAALAALADARLPLRVVRLAVRELPGSARPDELLHAAGIDADAIVEAVHSLVADDAPGRRPE
jgi:transketolase